MKYLTQAQSAVQAALAQQINKLMDKRTLKNIGSYLLNIAALLTLITMFAAVIGLICWIFSMLNLPWYIYAIAVIACVIIWFGLWIVAISKRLHENDY